jgi:hypothetical protein
MKSPQRVTQIEYQKRLDILMALCARGLPSSQLIKIACQQWDVSERQAKRYLKKAREQQSRLGSQSLEDRYSHLLLRFNYIYQQAILLRDLELARRTMSDLMQLFRQQQKDLMNDSSLSHQSRLVGSDELEALIQSLEEEGKNFPE